MWLLIVFSLMNGAAIAPMHVTLHDAARDRDVPLTIYLPAPDQTQHPLVVFSHGLGENRDSYSWFGRAMAANGFVAIHLTHLGSDKDVITRHGIIAIWRSTRKPQNWINRPLDVSFVLDRLEAHDPAIEAVSSRIDFDRIAVAGHSAGAYTAIALAGAHIGEAPSFRDGRIRAAVAMSMPRMGRMFHASSFSNIAIPVLHVTGTRDRSVVYWTFPRDRRLAFDETTRRGDQWLVTLRGAHHETFSDRDDSSSGREHAMRELTATVTVAFLQRYLEGETVESLPELEPAAATVESK